MNLTPMQLFCQEKILLSLYPWLSIEEAVQKEYIQVISDRETEEFERPYKRLLSILSSK